MLKDAITLPIPAKLALQHILKTHYAKRKPRIQHAYAIFIKNQMEGIITYGYPATPFVSRGLIGKEKEKQVIELNRLVINENAPKNTASKIISQSIKLLPKKYKIIITYADTSIGHTGTIYQATNFKYIGLTIPMKEWRNKNKNLHSQNVCLEKTLEQRRNDTSYEQIQRPQKHRYIYIRGTHKEKKQIQKLLKEQQLPYPKKQTQRYNTTQITEKQTILAEEVSRRDTP